MKPFLFALSLLIFNIPALADTAFVPKVGDFVSYSLQNSDSGSVNRMSSSNEITAIDQAKGNVSVRQIFTQNAVVVMDQVNEQALSSLYYPTIEQIQKCTSQTTETTTATLEKITVHAGTFQCCHLKDISPDIDGNTSDLYVANVPFGFIKSVQTNIKTGASQVMELFSYKKL